MAASVQALVQYWKNFDLPRLQKDLDLSATELANRQDESDGSRRRLVEQSRDFKKNTPEDIRKVVAPLLKSFQAEVDNLSKRSKAAEAAFLSVYKKIIEMPDPVTCLEHCLSLQSRAMRTQDLEIENHQLRETLNDYNQELRDVRHQEVTIKQLREQVRDYEDKLDTAIQAKTKEKESDLKRTFSDREQELKESHSVLSRKLEEAERKVTELQSALESTQSELFDLKSKYDEDSHAKSDEMDIIMNDLERANQRATLAEKEATNLKEQLSAAKHSLQLADQIQKAPDMEQAVDIVTRSSLEVELSAKEKEIAHLVEDIERLQSTLNTLKETSASKIAQLEGLVSEKEKIIGELGEKLMKQQDYTEIKKELGIMKSMEFGGSKPWEGEESHGGEGPPKPLEVLLLEKTKSLQSENTSLKVSKSELTALFASSEKEKEQLIQEVQQQKMLIIRLEEDLSRINSLSLMYRGEGEGQAETSLPAEIVAEATKEMTSSSILYGDDVGGAAETLLPIISSQRERFRSRNEELEEENAKLRNKVAALDMDMECLRTDNIKLYEKIKFLQVYPSRRPQSADDMESRYSAQYEERLDPFSRFSRKEKQRRYHNLSSLEKITYTMGHMVLSNKTARLFTVFYTVILHCLVFLVLYKLAYTETCRRDVAAECHARFAEHMQKVHGSASENL